MSRKPLVSRRLQGPDLFQEHHHNHIPAQGKETYVLQRRVDDTGGPAQCKKAERPLQTERLFIIQGDTLWSVIPPAAWDGGGSQQGTAGVPGQPSQQSNRGLQGTAKSCSFASVLSGAEQAGIRRRSQAIRKMGGGAGKPTPPRLPVHLLSIFSARSTCSLS